MQTVDIPLTQQTTETSEPVVFMEVDLHLQKKGKEKETLEETPENTTTTLDVDASFDTSENFLDKNTSSVQAFECQKPSFYGYFPSKNFQKHRRSKKFLSLST